MPNDEEDTKRDLKVKCLKSSTDPSAHTGSHIRLCILMCWFASVSHHIQHDADLSTLWLATYLLFTLLYCCFSGLSSSHQFPFPRPTVSLFFLRCYLAVTSRSCKTGPDWNCQCVRVCNRLYAMLHPYSHSWTLPACPHLKPNPLKISRWDQVSKTSGEILTSGRTSFTLPSGSKVR